MGFADLHIHTIHSWDCNSTVSAILKYIVDHTHLDVIAITDHDAISGAQEALDLAPKYGIDVIPGCEISTRDGHLLALFIDELVPPGLPLTETVLQVGEQGGLCIAPHPAARGVNALSFASIQSAIQNPEVARILVGIETFNAGIFHRKSNLSAEVFSYTLPLARVGNSDSHVLRTLGQGYTEFSGCTAKSLRRALKTRQTRVHVADRLTSPAEMMSNWLGLYLLRKAGWVRWNPSPQSPIRLGRASRLDPARSPLQAG